MKSRTLFVAGSTGATGKVLVPMADGLKIPVIPHVRPKSASSAKTDARANVVDLADTERLARALQGCTTVVQLIGTMKKRFAAGDTYESSDIGTTQQLVDAAVRSGSVDHFILLSSVGAGSPTGAYLKAKARAESIVTASKIPYTIFRPSALEGQGRKPPPLMKGLTRALGLKKYEPISLEDLSAAMLSVAAARGPLDAVLEGKSLWAEVSRARRP